MDALPAGAPVELRGDSGEGFPYAWLDATLVRCVRSGDALVAVRLTHITEDDGSLCVEHAALERLRPPAPGCSRAEALLRLADVYPPGSHVDARWSDVWWEAVVQDVPGSRDAIVVAYKGAWLQSARRCSGFAPQRAPDPRNSRRLRAASAPRGQHAAAMRRMKRASRRCGAAAACAPLRVTWLR
jgi:hypothetical protein